MVYIKSEEVVAYQFYDGISSELVCPDCLTTDEASGLTQEEVLTSGDLSEEDLHFCDRCQKRVG